MNSSVQEIKIIFLKILNFRLIGQPEYTINCRRKIFINSLFSLQAVESLRTIAAEHSSQDLENHFVPLVKRLSQGLLGSCVSQIRNYQAFMSNQGK